MQVPFQIYCKQKVPTLKFHSLLFFKKEPNRNILTSSKSSTTVSSRNEHAAKTQPKPRSFNSSLSQENQPRLNPFKVSSGTGNATKTTSEHNKGGFFKSLEKQKSVQETKTNEKSRKLGQLCLTIALL